MAENPTKITITGKLSYSDEITISQAAQIIAYLNSDEADGAQLSDPLLDTNMKRKPQAKKVENAREAIEVSGAQKNPEKIVALGAYVLQDGGDTFKAEDVKASFRRARETAPANFTRDINLAIAYGWIAEDEPGEFYLTNKVEGILDGGFAFPKVSGTARSRSGKKTGTKAKTGKPETLADIDEFESTMVGYPPFSKMKSEKDRLLWVALYMRDIHGRKGVTNKEIEFITDHIGTGIPNGNIAGAFNSAKGAGYAIRSTQDHSIRVMEPGVAYLAKLPAAGDA